MVSLRSVERRVVEKVERSDVVAAPSKIRMPRRRPQLNIPDGTRGEIDLDIREIRQLHRGIRKPHRDGAKLRGHVGAWAGQ